MVREVYLTDIERLFLQELESRGLRKGIDFSSQYPLRYSFILDFAWPDKRLAVELDGEPWHPPYNQRDAIKNAILKKKGWKIIRFKGQEIRESCKECVDKVLDELYSERIIKIRKEIDKLIWLGKTDNPKKQGILENITE